MTVTWKKHDHKNKEIVTINGIDYTVTAVTPFRVETYVGKTIINAEDKPGMVRNIIAFLENDEPVVSAMIINDMQYWTLEIDYSIRAALKNCSANYNVSQRKIGKYCADYIKSGNGKWRSY